MLNKIFEEIQKSKMQYATSNDGDAFEEKFMRMVKETFQYNRLLNQKAAKANGEISIEQHLTKTLGRELKFVRSEWKTLKDAILSKNSVEMIENPWKKFNRHFIHQPFGSQNYPDFIFFTKEYVIPIEIKYSKSSTSFEEKNLERIKPMWNSNLPKGNGIYVFGVAGKDVTFFSGSDVLDPNTRIQLNKFFDDFVGEDEDGQDITAKMSEYLKDVENPFGFKPYVRRAFDQSLSFSTNVDEEGNKYIESYFSDKRSQREKSVISLLEKIENGK